MADPLRTKAELIRFYNQQLEKFRKVGPGNQTEFNVKVTITLISATRRRLAQLLDLKRSTHRNGTI